MTPSWPTLRRQVTFQARLEGHKDFSLACPLIKMEPRATARLAITCSPTTAMPREARLVVAPYAQGGAAGEPRCDQRACLLSPALRSARCCNYV